MIHYIIRHYPTLSCHPLMFPLHSCTNPYRIVQDTKRNIRKTRSHGNNNNNYYRKILTTRMAIFYNPTEARSTLRRPSPGLPLCGEEKKNTQSLRCFRYIERVCSVPSSERGSNPALTLGGRRRGLLCASALRGRKKNNLYGFSFAQRCILELSEALSLTKGK